MEKMNLTKQFAYRLRDAMIAAGFNSQRSTSGVCIHKLSEITGYSVQICRKYLRGEAIPEPVKLAEIAMRLFVSPGWLLFGDLNNEQEISQDKISISKNLLHYIFSKASCLYDGTFLEQEIPNFLIELINDVSLIKASEEQSKKIIDLALATLKHFSHPRESKQIKS
ncbi:MAG: transcriptional regulator [Legionella longbeachae]|nr:transcriptional regulator [Legionella longbeachae]